MAAPSGGPVVTSSITLAPGQSVAAALATSGFGAVYPQAGAYAATAVVGLHLAPPTAPSGSSPFQSTTVGPLALTAH